MSTALTLYEIEDTRVALLDTLDLVETDEQKIEILRDIAAAEKDAVQKRDAVIAFRAQQLAFAEAAKAQAKRLKEHAEGIEKKVAHLDEYLVKVIEAFVPEPKRGNRKLECNLGTLSIAKNPDTVEITDYGQLPWEYLTATVKMPAVVWERLSGLLRDEELPGVTMQTEPVRAAIKRALEAGEDVPGADIRFGCNRLVVK